MSKYTVTLSGDGSTKVCEIDRRRADSNNWQGTAFISGTFGSGTVKLQFSPDGGTTKFDSKDWSGTAISTTANAMFVTQPMGSGDKLTDFISVYATITGSTNPSVSVSLFDNR